jgi:hypothetical protein
MSGSSTWNPEMGAYNLRWPIRLTMQPQQLDMATAIFDAETPPRLH